MTSDPLTLALVRGALDQITAEMDYTLGRGAFSTSMSEGYDYANGIYEASTGAVISQGPESLPIFMGVMQFAVQAIIRQIARRELAPGDIFISNDPYDGGTHLMDVKLLAPFFYGDRLVAFLANTGHWIDVGGGAPGGFGTQATELFQEGLIIPPLRLCKRGILDEEVVELIMANVRVPFETRGDLITQVNAIGVGKDRLTSLIDGTGLDTFLGCVKELSERSERLMRSFIDSIPDGEYHYEDFMDSDGITNEPLRIKLRLAVKGSDLLFDFTGSAPASRGPLNIPVGCTKAACYVALKHIFPEVPINAGCFKPIHFIIPEDTLVNPSRPRATSGFNEMSQRVIDVAQGALSLALPEVGYASAFSTSNNLTLGGEEPSRGTYVVYMFHGGGYGGYHGGDGLTHGSPPASSARTQPIEVYEQRYPLFFHKFAIREDSGGPGQFRGGFGTTYEFELSRGDAVMTLLGDRGRYGPPGILGGRPARTNQVRVLKGSQHYVPAHLTKDNQVPLKAGDRVIMETPGGGGYGNPLMRDVQAVADDVRQGLVSMESAKEDYGVVIDQQGKVDIGSTERLRQSRIEGDRGAYSLGSGLSLDPRTNDKNEQAKLKK